MSEEERAKARETLMLVYEAEKAQGYNAIDQMIGYLATGEPTYITNYNDARRMIERIDRDDLLDELLTSYFS